MIFRWFLKWAPFKIDAMGLVTIFGAEEVNHAIGRLATSRITQFLPIVGGHVIANDSIRSPLHGFTLYNISDGICATDVTGWFSRWLLFQSLTYNSTILTIDISSPFNAQRKSSSLPASLGVITFGFLIFLPASMTDWWGLANAISLGISVIVRWAIVKANMDSVDRLAESALQQSQTIVKTFWKLSDGTSVVIYAPRGVVTECLLTTPKPANLALYNTIRYIGWTTFFVHIVSLSMATLPNQLLCVSIMAVSTICVVAGLGGNEESIGSRIRIRRFDHCDGAASMASVFARLRLSTEEEESMIAWRLAPLPKNILWWRKYKDCLARNTLTAFEDWKDSRTWVAYERAGTTEACIEDHYRANLSASNYANT